MRRDPAVIVLPLLQRLYAASPRNPSALYMLLIVLLILSQDTAFAKAIHTKRVPAVPWFRERLMQSVSLGEPRAPARPETACLLQCDSILRVCSANRTHYSSSRVSRHAGSVSSGQRAQLQGPSPRHPASHHAPGCAGSLLVAVLLRTAHRNLSRLRDVYLHTNMLAALVNLAPHFEGIAPHAAQRLVALIDTLARRHVTADACQSGGVGLQQHQLGAQARSPPDRPVLRRAWLPADTPTKRSALALSP